MGYFGMLAAWYVVVGTSNRAGRWWHGVPLSINLIGVFYSFLLVWVMWAQLGASCGWCLIVHGLNLLLFACGWLLWPWRRGDPDAAARPSFRLGLAGVLLLASIGITMPMTAHVFRIQTTLRGAVEYIDRYRHDADLMRYKYARQSAVDMAVRPDDPVRGNPQARHTVVVFSDFECPQCRKFSEFFERDVAGTRGDEVRLVFKHYPLDSACNAEVKWARHPGACEAAYAAEAARELGGVDAFWKTHDLLFAAQNRPGRPSIAELARALKLDESTLGERVRRRAHRDRIASDVALARRLDVRGTPAVFVDGKRLDEWESADNWRAILNPVEPEGSDRWRPEAPDQPETAPDG